MLALTMAFCVASFFPPPAEASVPSQIRVQNVVFERIGCGMRKIFWKNVYALCLYTGPRSASMLRMDIVYKGKMPDGMPDDWRPKLQKVISQETIYRVDSYFAQLSTGDVVQFAYLPVTQESKMFINNEAAISIPGAALYDTVQSMWLGEQPISKRLKSLILQRICDICN